MPKKPAKNAFYFYMMDFREEQRKKGVKYADTKAIADAAGPYWKELPASARAKYEAMAKKEKQKYNVPEMKYTSTGISYAQLEEQERYQREMEEKEYQDVTSFVKLKSLKNDILKEDIFLFDVNYFCKVGDTYLIGEHTILRFNLLNGIQDRYHEIINPGTIPTGYASDVKLACEELALEMPDTNRPITNKLLVMANIFDYLKKQNPHDNVLPPVYTMPEKVAPVSNYIQQLCRKANEQESLFRVYKLDLLFYALINGIKTNPEDGFPKQSLAMELLKKDSFQYSMGLGCEVHEPLDKSVVCTLSRVKRWAYTIMDSCCPLAGIQMQDRKHVPHTFSMESFMAHKDEKEEKHGSSVARAMPSYSESYCDSDENYSVTSFSTSVSTQEQKPEAQQQSMRKPQDRSKIIPNAPGLSEEDFPALSKGRGRGQGLFSSFSRLNLN